LGEILIWYKGTSQQRCSTLLLKKNHPSKQTDRYG